MKAKRIETNDKTWDEERMPGELLEWDSKQFEKKMAKITNDLL